jgi:hypothetical protein
MLGLFHGVPGARAWRRMLSAGGGSDADRLRLFKGSESLIRSGAAQG